MRAALHPLPPLAVLALAVLAPAVLATPLPGQEPPNPRPGFQATLAGPEAIRLTVCVPEGWALYAPERPDRPDPGVGLPLRIRAGDVPVVPTEWPRATTRGTPWGPSWIHQAGCFGAVLPRPAGPGAARSLEFRWALCQALLCVPGRSRVPVDGGESEPSPVR